jgi:energy-coupling factor transporter ATP-binding protein EcfA2
MTFSKLTINGWRQFSEIEIDFHPQLTVITGANGAGKSTLLRILSQHFGWSQPLLATPMLSKDGRVRYFSGWFDWLFNTQDPPPQNFVGSIKYSSGIQTQLVIPAAGGVVYNLQIQNQQPVFGLHINSHRPISTYQQVSNIPTNAIGAEQAYQTYNQETMYRYQNTHTQFGPTYRMKEAIISMATFGPGNQYVQANPVVADLFIKFKSTLTKILPSQIGFRDISVRIPDVVLVTETGDFVLDAASGGLLSLIDLAWQIFLYSQGKDRFTVTFDEPENHLHPSMQRGLMKSLISAFPNTQFIVATHSPFIVSSVRDSLVYVLRYDESERASETGVARRISSVKLDNVNKAGTASEILRDVLGVPVTLPEWAEEDLRQITSRFQLSSLDGERIAELRRNLDQAGLGEFYPDALRRLASPA